MTAIRRRPVPPVVPRRRRVFYSFHFDGDVWRTNQIRNAGIVEGNPPVTANDWEEVKRQGDDSVKRWIDGQFRGRSCVVVLVGSETADRPWVHYEIVRGWNLAKGVVGVRIHNLEDSFGLQAPRGRNPFEDVTIGGRYLMSDYVALHDPPFLDSRQVYRFITNNIADWCATAVWQRSTWAL